MPRQKNHFYLLNIVLFTLSLLLIYPKTSQIMILFENSLTPQDYAFLTQSKPLLVLGIIMVEVITMTFNFIILHWLYKFSQLDILLRENIYLYLLCTTLSKLLTLPFTYPLLTNLVFTIIFILMHYQFTKPKKGQWLWISIFPILNVLFSAI
ncbi:MAG TPA: hypothetical protein VKY25_00115 [Erysipelothrix sp.]|nr:hypothetical protein [Erysipelothrix sp.]